MSVGLVKSKMSFANKLSGYLQEVDYRVVKTDKERDDIFKLRYKCYLKEGAISPCASQRFSDDYDNMENCWIFGIYIDERLVSSIRFHVISPEDRKGPAADVFPDVVLPMLEQGQTVVDPTRLVVDYEASREYPELHFATMRVACMAAEFFGADYCLATVRQEHQAFYRRIFNFKRVCEPRPYPTLLKPISLLAGDMDTIRNEVASRYPLFVSSFTERKLLFEQVNMPGPLARFYNDVVNA